MAKMTGGDLLVQCLAGHGVKYIFSIIGGQMCSVYEAARVRPEIALVTLRNEAAAPVMAGGYAAASGIPAVSMCTVGAGVVYEVAGLMDAWMSYLPVISIAPQVQSWKMKPHQENLQGMNQDEIFYPITKWNAIVYHWERIPQMVARALREARANAPGPVHLDLPVDVLFKTGKPSDKKMRELMPPPETTRFSGALPGTEDEVKAGIEAVRAARRPVALIGQAMGTAGRYEQMAELLNAAGLPALTARSSSSAMSGKDGCFAGPLGLFMESGTGRAILEQADALVVVGIDPEIMDALKALTGFGGTTVQVEVDPSAVLTGRAKHVGVNADPVSFFKRLDAGEGRWKEWAGKVREAREAIVADEKKNIPDAALYEGLALAVKDDDVLVVDGKAPARAARALLANNRHHRLFIMNHRDMAGPGLPFAIGARLALPANPVTLITDLDSLMRHPQELKTAEGLGLDVRIVVTDPGRDQRHARTEAVLGGLGCEINTLRPGTGPDREKRKRPSAWLVQ